MALSDRYRELALDTLMDQLDTIIICLDIRTTILDFNQQAENAFGITKEAALGNTLFDVCRKYNIDSPSRSWPTREIKKIIFNLPSKDSLDLTIAPLIHDDIFHGYLIFGSRNIIIKEKESNLSSYLNTVINNIPHFLFWKNTDSVFLGCNRHFAEACGFNSPDDIIGKTDFNMPWNENAKSYVSDDKEIIASRTPKLNYEEKQRQLDGSEKTMLVDKVPILNAAKEVIGIFCIYTDISIRKGLEEELRIAKEEAERANEAKSEFIAVASHELRIPLTGILGIIDLLKNEALSSTEKNNYNLHLSKSSSH